MVERILLIVVCFGEGGLVGCLLIMGLFLAWRERGMERGKGAHLDGITTTYTTMIIILLNPRQHLYHPSIQKEQDNLQQPSTSSSPNRHSSSPHPSPPRRAPATAPASSNPHLPPHSDYHLHSHFDSQPPHARESLQSQTATCPPAQGACETRRAERNSSRECPGTG